MIVFWHIVIGLVLGLVGGAAHLWLVHVRARRAVQDRAGLAMALYPLGLAAIALPVFAATQVAPVAAYATLPGIMLVRWLVLRDAGRPRKRATS